MDELCGLVQPAESPEELAEQIHHVEIENAKLEATTAAQSAQIRSTHTMCYILALFCMLLSFSLIACLVTDAQIRNAGLIRGGDLSLYGLSNAITRAAQDVESYDRSTEMESIGYTVLGMSRSDWQRLNAAVVAA